MPLNYNGAIMMFHINRSGRCIVLVMVMNSMLAVAIGLNGFDAFI
jgi:hypothetical protein